MYICEQIYTHIYISKNFYSIKTKLQMEMMSFQRCIFTTMRTFFFSDVETINFTKRLITLNNDHIDLKETSIKEYIDLSIKG